MKSSRTNMKPCRSSSSSSIISLAEELLIEILLRVPARTLGRFKCVSKHWLFVISDPEFCHRHTSRNRNSSISAVFGDSSTDFSSITFPPAAAAGSNPFNNFVHGPIEIINSCNGLFFCRPVDATSTSRTPYFVLNPTTNQFLTLTIPTVVAAGQTDVLGCALAFDPSKSPHYKVICLETTTPDIYCLYYQIQIYSSATRSWKLLNSSFCRQDQILYEQGVYWNGAIHWVGLVCEMSYYQVDEEYVGLVDSPPHCYEKKWENRMYRYFKESTGGHLHLIDLYAPCLTKFEVLEMGRDYSGWFVKYQVDLDPLCFPCEEFVVLFLADEDENEEEESCSSLLLHSPGTVISYHLKSKTIKSSELSICQHLLVGDSNYPYMETLACV